MDYVKNMSNQAKQNFAENREGFKARRQSNTTGQIAAIRAVVVLTSLLMISYTLGADAYQYFDGDATQGMSIMAIIIGVLFFIHVLMSAASASNSWVPVVSEFLLATSAMVLACLVIWGMATAKDDNGDALVTDTKDSWDNRWVYVLSAFVLAVSLVYFLRMGFALKHKIQNPDADRKNKGGNKLADLFEE